MSERGSFCTEFIYCPECQRKALGILAGWAKEYELIHAGAVIAGWIRECPGYPGEEFTRFECGYRGKGDAVVRRLSQAICHSVRLCVMADSGETRAYRVYPWNNWQDEYYEVNVWTVDDESF